MAYSTTSKYVQLTPYLLMEYMYADQPQPEDYFVNSGPSTIGYDKLINGYQDNAVQVFNPNNDYSITQNTASNSVVQISTNSFVTLDSNLIIPFNDYSDQLTNTVDLPIVFPSNLLVIYDTVRYHIRAGYNLSNIDGLILKIEFQDQNLNYVTASQILLKKGTEQDYELNPNPVVIGSNIYDKYFQIKIPNLKDMNYKYLSASDFFRPQTLASLISQSGDGFVSDAPIRISAWQVQSTTDFEGYSRYDSARIALLSLEQEDPFSNIGATIKESSRGQFFEYYATDNEGFVEDFILFQNSIGNSYYISHQIEVLEQIGAAIIETSRFESTQTTAYDSPNYYRPIVRNAAYSSSFFLRYTMSLINSVDQSRVVRISTYASNNPAQWGTTITPIKLQNLPQVQKIYNRVYSASSISVGSNNTPVPKEIFKYTNVFIQQNYVTATAANLTFINGNLTQNNGTSNVTALGVGKLIIPISPFDNYFKFKFVKEGPNGIPVAIDLSNSGLYKIAFLDDAGNKNYVLALEDNNIAKPALGELAFKVDESQSTKVLNFSDRRFFITNGNVTAQSNTLVNPVVDAVVNPVVSAVVNPTANPQSVQDTDTVASNSQLRSIASNGTPAASIPLTTQTPISNESTSVLFWGYWKKEGEVIVLPTDTTNVIPPTTTSATTSVNQLVSSITQAPRSNIVQSIQPAFSRNIGTFTGEITATARNRSGGNTNQQLSGSALIGALAAQMQGFVATGWAEQTIVDYFLTPGKPGYIQYPGLTKDQFKIAANGILSTATLSTIV
jgi:hypothetical protein